MAAEAELVPCIASPRVRAGLRQQRDAFRVVCHREDVHGRERTCDGSRVTAGGRQKPPLPCDDATSIPCDIRSGLVGLCESKRAHSEPSCQQTPTAANDRRLLRRYPGRADPTWTSSGLEMGCNRLTYRRNIEGALCLSEKLGESLRPEHLHTTTCEGTTDQRPVGLNEAERAEDRHVADDVTNQLDLLEHAVDELRAVAPTNQHLLDLGSQNAAFNLQLEPVLVPAVSAAMLWSEMPNGVDATVGSPPPSTSDVDWALVSTLRAQAPEQLSQAVQSGRARLPIQTPPAPRRSSAETTATVQRTG